MYGEWETTAEAKTVHRTFHESVRFPWPAQPVRVDAPEAAGPNNAFATVWSTDVDPASRFVNAAPLRAHAGTVWTVFENGPAAEKVDLLVISEGYTQAELPKFHATPRGWSTRCSRRSRSRAARRLQRPRPRPALGRRAA